MSDTDDTLTPPRSILTKKNIIKTCPSFFNNTSFSVDEHSKEQIFNDEISQMPENKTVNYIY